MLPREVELVSEWSVKSFERSDGLAIAQYKNILLFNITHSNKTQKI